MRVIDLKNEKVINISDSYSHLITHCPTVYCDYCPYLSQCDNFANEYNTRPYEVIDYDEHYNCTLISRLLEFLVGCILIGGILVFLIIITSLVFMVTGIGQYNMM